MKKLYTPLLLCLLAASAFAEVPISALPAGAALTGTEDVPVVQSAVTVKTTPVDIRTFVRATTLLVANGGTGAVTLTGPLKGNGTSAVGAALAADIYGLWSGTCNGSSFLRGDGACAAASAAAGGSTGQIQYNNAGALGGGDIQYAKLSGIVSQFIMGLAGEANAQIIGQQGTATGVGTGLLLDGGPGGATSGAGGAVQLRGGLSTDGAGGAAILTARGGVGTNRAGGGVSISSGTATGTAAGGVINVTAGNGGPTGNGGTLTLQAGSGGATSGTAAIASLNAGSSGASSGLDGGTARVIGGAGNGIGVGGQVLLQGGTPGTTGKGGSINLVAVAGGSTSGAGGDVNLEGGSATNGQGGSITLAARNGAGTNQAGGIVSITAGNPTGSGTSGYIQFAGMEAGAQSATAPVITNGTTITVTGVGLARVAPGGAVTGIILQAGTIGGQRVVVVNESAAASSATMAASGTSRVANGTGCVIAGNQARGFVWNSSTSLWYEMK